MENKITTHITKGIIIALILAVIDLIGGFAHVKFEAWFRWIPSILLFIALIWVCLNFASQNSHNVTFGNIFAHGFKTSAVVACITLIYFFLATFLIFPETRDQVMQQTREQMEAQGKLTQDQIDSYVEMTRKFFILGGTVGIVLGTLFIGVIASLIGAAVAKKNPVTPFDKQP